jgi:hypothetical protein
VGIEKQAKFGRKFVNYYPRGVSRRIGEALAGIFSGNVLRAAASLGGRGENDIKRHS